MVPTQPKLCAATIVANECDIIESFARHTLSFVDHLHILLHNSYDSSRHILRHLVAEGLPIGVEVAATTTYSRERMVDDLVRRLAAGGRFDYLLPLDADEFIVAGSRAELEAELAGMPAGGALSLAWLTFVPSGQDDAADPNPVTRIRRRLGSPHPGYRKVFFTAALLEHEDVYLADGNHRLLSRSGRAIPQRDASRVSLAHFPVRDAQQLASKAAIGSIARRLSADYTDDRSRHWRSMMADPALTTDAPVAVLSRIAMGYLGGTDAELVDAPLATSARSLRYAELIRVNAFERLSGFVAAAFEERAPSGLADETSRQGLLKELADAHHAMQRLHEELRAVKQDARRRVRKARRKARFLAIAAICAIVLIAAAVVAYLQVT